MYRQAVQGARPQVWIRPSLKRIQGDMAAAVSGRLLISATRESMSGIERRVSSLRMRQNLPVTCLRARLLFSEKPRSSVLGTIVTQG